MPKKTQTATPATKKKPTKLEIANPSAEIFLALIHGANRPISGPEIKKLYKQAGHDPANSEHWGSLRDKIKLHPCIRITGAGNSLRFAWTEPIPPGEALARLTEQPNEPRFLREAWRDVVAAALAEPQGDVNPTLRRAQERQAKIDVVRAVAELAIEVEEIAHNGADSQQIVKRARTAAALRNLVPIGVAGEDTRFDPAIHKLQFGDPKPGIPVFIMKPGYTWLYGDDTIVIEHALVATA